MDAGGVQTSCSNINLIGVNGEVLSGDGAERRKRKEDKLRAHREEVMRDESRERRRESGDGWSKKKLGIWSRRAIDNFYSEVPMTLTKTTATATTTM